MLARLENEGPPSPGNGVNASHNVARKKPSTGVQLVSFHLREVRKQANLERCVCQPPPEGGARRPSGVLTAS